MGRSVLAAHNLLERADIGLVRLLAEEDEADQLDLGTRLHVVAGRPEGDPRRLIDRVAVGPC